ncbi:MAG: hypothetical protein PHV34_16500 [Verrucomicrobiae bacterium]|nr:hypothetical protein [Verrucomicrobiae bacterium]
MNNFTRHFAVMMNKPFGLTNAAWRHQVLPFAKYTITSTLEARRV